MRPYTVTITPSFSTASVVFSTVGNLTDTMLGKCPSCSTFTLVPHIVCSLTGSSLTSVL